MWFDVTAALAEIEGGQEIAPESRTLATSASLSARVAKVAGVAGPSARIQKSVKPVAVHNVRDGVDMLRHGLSVQGTPRTWTGKVVTRDEWRRLSLWERHGPQERKWNGLTQRWE